MSTQYPTFIRKRGYLNVVPTPDFLKAPAWGLSLFNAAIYLFNQMSQRYKLGVTMQTVADSWLTLFAPDVIVQPHSGSGTYFDTAGKEQKVKLPMPPRRYVAYTHPENIGGSKLDPGYFRFQSWIFMPLEPTIDGVPIGPMVRIAVLLHEMLHACGLDSDDPNHGDEDHMAPNPRDLYSSAGIFEHSSADKTGATDYINWLTARCPTVHGTFDLSPVTVRLMQQNWAV